MTMRVLSGYSDEMQPETPNPAPEKDRPSHSLPAALDAPVVCPVQIGRDSQLDALRLLADGVAAGSGQTVLVAGEAGIGKSRLARELADGLGPAGWMVLQGSCFERDRAQPYGPLAELLRHALGSPPPPVVLEHLGLHAIDLARVLPELRRMLPSNVELEWTSPQHDRRHLFQVIGDVLVDVATRAPLLLIVEDLHWADDASLDFLSSFARTLARLRFCCCSPTGQTSRTAPCASSA